MHHPGWVPADVDLDRPNAARILDYLLGGAHNFAVDRSAAKQACSAVPELAVSMRASRSFLRRAVTHLVHAGIDQFLDLGSGVPTVGNVHEIAHRINPDARVVYVDNEPIAVAHSRTILAGNPMACTVRADLRRPDMILEHPEVLRMIDFDRPIGLILVAVLHFLPDRDGPAALVGRYRQAMAADSQVVISHGSKDCVPADQLGRIEELGEVYRQTSSPLYARTRAEITKLFDGFELVEPGVVPVGQWRSEWVERNEGTLHLAFGGVGHKP